MDTGDYYRIPPGYTPLSTIKESLDYNMCHRNRGICLILENESFSKTSFATRDLPKRVGSEHDREMLVDLFTKLAFHVVVHKDLTVEGIRQAIKQVALLDHSESDCFACVVLTHGSKHGQLFAYDNRYELVHLTNDLIGSRCPTLIGKPKLFFVQACLGDRIDKGVLVSGGEDVFDSVSSFKIPNYADCLFAYSTIQGFYSFRNVDKGSWFIRALVQVIGERHNEFDLLSMLTMVCHHVAYYFTSNSPHPELTGLKQLPSTVSLLTRRVFLLPKTIQL